MIKSGHVVLMRDLEEDRLYVGVTDDPVAVFSDVRGEDGGLTAADLERAVEDGEISYVRVELADGHFEEVTNSF